MPMVRTPARRRRQSQQRAIGSQSNLLSPPTVTHGREYWALSPAPVTVSTTPGRTCDDWPWPRPQKETPCHPSSASASCVGRGALNATNSPRNPIGDHFNYYIPTTLGMAMYPCVDPASASREVSASPSLASATRTNRETHDTASPPAKLLKTGWLHNHKAGVPYAFRHPEWRMGQITMHVSPCWALFQPLRLDALLNVSSTPLIGHARVCIWAPDPGLDCLPDQSTGYRNWTSFSWSKATSRTRALPPTILLPGLGFIYSIMTQEHLNSWSPPCSYKRRSPWSPGEGEQHFTVCSPLSILALASITLIDLGFSPSLDQLVPPYYEHLDAW
jgi:hypothetical protein